MSVSIPRRAMLVRLGLGVGGLALMGSTRAVAQHLALSQVPSVEAGFRPNVFVHIATDGLVTIACARSEMGQGVRSSLPALIADELGADFARVKIVQADGDKAYGDQNTDGSTSVRKAFDDLRRTGAAARMMLASAAARRWKVPVSELEVHDHVVTHARSKRSAGFGELASVAAKLSVPATADIVLRPRSELRMLGKAMPLVDAPDIVTGRAIYAADLKLPGMLVAVIARPPVAGGKLLAHDASRALTVPGVRRVVVLPALTLPFKFQPLGGVAVVADNTWAAMRGREALDVTWDHGANAEHESGAYRKTLEAAVSTAGKAWRNIGDVDGALAGGSEASRGAVLHAVPPARDDGATRRARERARGTM
ncbi:MAG TPA: molybdopterin cofactor-binding domain-containing protein [Polyangiales bacterium]|nr:molybdopterin cofactor-binding domain-containing protein [Polyangiales bacterium]